MLKNLTTSGKVNLITEIIAIITWAILLIAAKDDWLFFAVFSIPLLILIPICGWFLVPVSKKISEKGKSKSGWWKAAWYAGMFVVNLFAAFILMIQDVYDIIAEADSMKMSKAYALDIIGSGSKNTFRL